MIAAAADPPAGGAALDQVIIATGMAVAVSVVLVAVCVWYMRGLGGPFGTGGPLAFSGRIAEKITGLPAWAMVPSGLALITLLPALFGLQWDESTHIAQGRDEGPLANPSHYFLLVGIYGGFAAGVLALVMGDDRVPASGIRAAGLQMPLGGVLASAGSAFALLGFPLDDVWHRLFGQDVTLWSATHITMIAGMSLGVVGLLVLNVEAMRSRRRSGAPRRLLDGPVKQIQRFMIPAALLLVLSLLQGEFDYGVAQFRLVFHPMLVMGAAGLALVAARSFMGPGAALGGAVVFLAIRGLIALLVGPVLGQPDHLFPLYLAEAALIELVALRISPQATPLRFGLWCGAAIGTLGLAGEWAWSTLYPIPWTAGLFPEALILAPAMAIAGGVLGAWLGAHLAIAPRPRDPALRTAAVAASVAVTALIGYGLISSEPTPVRADVTLDEVVGAPQRTAYATVRLDPADAAEGVDALRTIAWQGDGLIGSEMVEIGDGVYRSAEALPLYGNWKTAIRLLDDRSSGGLVLYVPRDDAIPVGELSRPQRFTAAFGDQEQFLRRESKDVAGWVWTTANFLVAAVMFALLYAWALALRRLSDPPQRGEPGPPPAASAPKPRIEPAPRARVAG